MGDVTNLNKARKARLRAEREKAAAENRVRHGRTKTERVVEKIRNARDVSHLDGHLGDPGHKPPGS